MSATPSTDPGSSSPSASTNSGKGWIPAGWRHAPFVCGLASSLLLFASYPPLDLWPLALVAPAPLLWLARNPRPLAGPHPYRWIWLGSGVGWLALLQGIRLPHPALYAGWMVLSLYVAVYPPLTVGLCRIALHRWRLPFLVAAPPIWVGLEWFRGYVATGFSVGLAGHPLIAWPTMIQIADLAGAYAVSFVVVIVAASLAQALPGSGQSWRPWPVIPMTIALGVSWLYGNYRMQRLPERQDMRDAIRVASLQCAQDVVFVDDPQRAVEVFEQCLEQAALAKKAHPDLLLILWPESSFSANRRDLIIDGPPRPPQGLDIEPERLIAALNWATDEFEKHRHSTAQRLRSEHDSDTYQLFGTHTEVYGDHDRELMNTAMLLGPQGSIEERYFKNHRVMFGEYIPLGDQIPAIYSLTPMGQGLTPAETPMAFTIAGISFSPNICFESTVPHLIRRQFHDLASQGEAPDVLVNLTNDGWFWGSAILDLHFACNVFRAVELRRPVLVSANTGVTACVDDAGRVLEIAPRRAVGFVTAHVRPARVARSIYCQIGDWPAAICGLFVAVLLLSAVGRPQPRRTG